MAKSRKRRSARVAPGTKSKRKKNVLVLPSADIVIPVVFPDYRIGTGVSDRVLRPYVRKLGTVGKWAKKQLDATTGRDSRGTLPNLGHAGILFISGRTGTTKYYEYGRYDKAQLGLVRKKRIPDVKLLRGKPTKVTLLRTLRQISRKGGRRTRISGALIVEPGAYGKMLKYAESRKALNRNPKRKPYDVLSNNCGTFMKDVMAAGGINVPWLIDPRPNSYIGEVRDKFNDLDYAYRTNSLTLEDPSTITP